MRCDLVCKWRHLKITRLSLLEHTQEHTIIGHFTIGYRSTGCSLTIISHPPGTVPNLSGDETDHLPPAFRFYSR